MLSVLSKPKLFIIKQKIMNVMGEREGLWNDKVCSKLLNILFFKGMILVPKKYIFYR